MKDLMMVFAAALPEEKILEELKTAITAHEAATDEEQKKETRGKLSMYASLFLAKDMIGLKSEKSGKNQSEKKSRKDINF